jgi:alginate O-acetyltransferase complex protein AlgI
MIFTNPIFFIFLVVVVVLLILPIKNKSYKKVILLVSSYYFYGYWDVRFLILIAISTIIDFVVGKSIYKTVAPKKRRLLLAISIISNLGILGVFKYYNFFVTSFIDILNQFGIHSSFATLNIILPVGISFYTFQTMSYTIDIYRKELQPTKSILDFSVFVSFFPQLVAGPIERARNLLPQIKNFNGIVLKGIKPALILMFMGYLKKVVISDNIAPLVDEYFLNYAELDSIYLITGLILFSFQIYFDFSGYSDIARGLAKLLGIDLMINFNQPYFSMNFSEFWKRWHISLSSWLKDYLYIPLGGNKKGKFRTKINLMTTMLLGGLWHGASWNFVIWGGLHGIYLIFGKILNIHNKSGSNALLKTIKSILQILIVQFLVLLTWLPFRSPDLRTTGAFLERIFFWQGGLNPSSIGLIALMYFSLIVIDLPAYLTKDHLYLLRLPKWILIVIIVVGVIAISLTMILYQNSVRPFIYFQF